MKKMFVSVFVIVCVLSQLALGSVLLSSIPTTIENYPLKPIEPYYFYHYMVTMGPMYHYGLEFETIPFTTIVTESQSLLEEQLEDGFDQLMNLDFIVIYEQYTPDTVRASLLESTFWQTDWDLDYVELSVTKLQVDDNLLLDIEYSWNLYGTVVPEPSVFLLGLAGMLFFRRKI